MSGTFDFWIVPGRGPDTLTGDKVGVGGGDSRRRTVVRRRYSKVEAWTKPTITASSFRSGIAFACRLCSLGGEIFLSIADLFFAVISGGGTSDPLDPVRTVRSLLRRIVLGNGLRGGRGGF